MVLCKGQLNGSYCVMFAKQTCIYRPMTHTHTCCIKSTIVIHLLKLLSKIVDQREASLLLGVFDYQHGVP